MKIRISLLPILCLLLSLARPAGAASVALSGLPATNSVAAGDEIILNVTNAGAGTFTTKRIPAQVLLNAAASNALAGAVVSNRGHGTNTAFHDATAAGSVTVTNSANGGGNGPDDIALVITALPDTNALPELVFKGPNGGICYFSFWPVHGNPTYPTAPELVRYINGSFCDYYYWYQWGDPSGGHGPEWWWFVSGTSPYVLGGITDTNLTDCKNLAVYDAVYWSNGVARYAGAATATAQPATLFRALDTNGNGAWIWYDRFNAAPAGTWPNYHRNYDTAVERFRITAGPNGGATLKGPMVADDFQLSNGRSITNGAATFTGFTNLAAGAVVVLSSNVSSTSIILLTYGSEDGTIASLGEDIPSRVPGASFTVKSSNAVDTNSVSWAILPGTVEIAFDADARDYFTRAGITDHTQKVAVNTFVESVKAMGAWNYLHAVYPMVGGTAGAHAINLRSNACSITWSNTVTHDAYGVTGDGASGCGFTGYKPATAGQTTASAHFCVYQRKADCCANEGNSTFLGSTEQGAAYYNNFLGAQRAAGSYTNACMAGPNASTQADPYVQGTYVPGSIMVNRTNAASAEWYYSGADHYMTNNAAVVCTGVATQEVLLLAAKLEPWAPFSFTSGTVCFASMGLGMPSNVMASYLQAVATLQQALNRQ